jgi:hypothetical protein
MHTQITQSCLYNLSIDEPELAETTCQFSARKQVIEPTYIRLDKGVFILSNCTHVIAHGVQLLPRTAAIELKQLNITEQPSTISYLQIVARNLDQIRRIDFVLAALCVTALISCITVIFIIVRKRKLTRRSALYADIITAKKTVLKRQYDIVPFVIHSC